ncbi:MAG: TonB-dependent receptor [Xanthomonadales bacterium]|jgi:outer membrane receptor protein involved in Fe transport|nr:TonB-dependent receptor [Xanthomonadales bacterium]
MKKLKETCLIVTLLVQAPAVSAAASNAGDSEARVLEEVIVGATRAPAMLMEIPANASLLDREDIEEFSMRTVDDILRQIPGFSTLRAEDSISSAAVVNTVSLRGLGGNAASRTLVMLDGIPLNNPNSSEIFWARIPKHQIERIEVVRGGGANSWGNLSMGGVINIVTEKPREDGLGFTGSLGYPLTIDAGLSASDVAGKWRYSAYAEYYDTDGYLSVPAQFEVPADRNVWKKHGILNARAEYRAGENTRLFLGANGFSEDRGGGSEIDINLTENRSADIGMETLTGDGGSWTFRAFYDDNELEDWTADFSPSGESETVRSLDIQSTGALGASLVWAKSLPGGHEINAGADYRWTDLDYAEYSRYLGTTPRTVTNLAAAQDMGGVFIQGGWQVSERWRVNGSLRYDYFTNTGSDQALDLESGLETDRNYYASNSETTINPSIGAIYRLNDSVSFRAAAYRGFRAPTLRELYRASFARGGVILVNNPYLEPERLVGVEGGADFFLGADATLRLTLFRNTVENQVQNITRGINGATPGVIEPCGLLGPYETCRELDNVGEMQATGLEVEAEWRPGTEWTLQFSYLHNDTEVTEAPDNPALIGTPVRQAPKNAFTARARHYGSWFDTSLVARYVGKRYEDDLARLEVDDFLLFDLRLTRRLNDTTELFLAVENILDEEYEVKVENDGFTEIGKPRFVYIGLNYRR